MFGKKCHDVLAVSLTVASLIFLSPVQAQAEGKCNKGGSNTSGGGSMFMWGRMMFQPAPMYPMQPRYVVSQPGVQMYAMQQQQRSTAMMSYTSQLLRNAMMATQQQQLQSQCLQNAILAAQQQQLQNTILVARQQQLQAAALLGAAQVQAQVQSPYAPPAAALKSKVVTSQPRQQPQAAPTQRLGLAVEEEPAEFEGSPEGDAARKYQMARGLADEAANAHVKAQTGRAAKMRERAIERLQEIVRDFPGTRAAGPARELLEKLGQY